MGVGASGLSPLLDPLGIVDGGRQRGAAAVADLLFPGLAARPPTPPEPLTDTPWRQETDYGNPLFSRHTRFHLDAELASAMFQTFLDKRQEAAVYINEEQMKQNMEGQFSSDHVRRANALLLGPIKAGKSSFLNSVASICKGRIANIALTGEAEASLTTQYGRFAPKKKNFCLLDCMGLERQGHGFNVEDTCYLVKGNVPRDYKFNPVSPITPDDPRFITHPREKDKVHCVVYVVDAEALYGDLPNEIKRRIVELQTKLNSLGLQRVLILTKVDRLCDKVSDDITNLYRSVKVQDIVKKASEIFRMPENLIYPVKNYASETSIDWRMNIPILLALTKILNFAEDYIEKMHDNSSDED